MNLVERGALEHENWISYLTGVVRCAGAGGVARHGGTVAIVSDIPFDWFNQVLVERSDATPADLLAGIRESVDRDRPCIVRLRTGLDDRLLPTLEGRGRVLPGRDEPAR